MDNKNNKKVFDTILEPLGEKSRRFIIDYHDKKSKYFHVENLIFRACENQDELISLLKRDLESKGFSVYMIVEVIGDYTEKDLIKMSASNCEELLKHVKYIYYDPEKEKIH